MPITTNLHRLPIRPNVAERQEDERLLRAWREMEALKIPVYETEPPLIIRATAPVSAGLRRILERLSS